MSNNRHNLTAIIYDKKGNILSIGKNNYVKTHPLQQKYAKRVGQDHRVFLHAEIHAIVKCRSLDKAHRILITRYNTKGQPLLAKPCKICETAILNETPIKRIEYTTAATD